MLPDDAEARLAAWLAAEVDETVSSVEITRLAGGHSSGAWRVDLRAARDLPPMVLKAPGHPSPVFGRDAAKEGRILRELGRLGARVPRVHAIDDEGRAVDRPCFVMELVEARAPADLPPGSYHDDPWLHEAGPAAQRAIWDSFHDALAEIHRVDVGGLAESRHGDAGMVDVLRYWRESLLDVVVAGAAPRQLALLDWQEAHLPADAGTEPALCMGDARLVNCLVVGTDVRALIDFEIAYLGDPAADIGYSLFLDGQGRDKAAVPLAGPASADETWRRWEAATGRRVPMPDRAYWKAFGAMVLAVTATRFMVQLGLPATSVDADNPVVGAWEAAVLEADPDATTL